MTPVLSAITAVGRWGRCPIPPGDRANECRGDLKPVGVELSGKKGMVILYRCQKCGQLHKNVSAKDDDYDKLVRLSAHEEIE